MRRLSSRRKSTVPAAIGEDSGYEFRGRRCKITMVPVRPLLLVVCSAALIGLGSHASRAQLTFYTAPTLHPLEPVAPSVYSGLPDLFGRPSNGDEGLPIGNWLVFPSSFAGVLFDTNPNQSPTNSRASPGLRLRTNSYAQNEDGINKTILYSDTDLDLHANQSNTNGNSADNLSTRTGVLRAYKPFADLLFTARGDLTRQENYFSPLGVSNNLSSLNPTGVGVSPTASPQPYTQLAGTGSVQKNFSDSYVIASGSIVNISYDKSSTLTAPSPNGITYTGTGRYGYWVIPDLYAYLEGSLDDRSYQTSALSSKGYRALAGLGSDQFGLFRGELYAGYQAEGYDSNTIGTARGPVVGGRGGYSPLPELTIDASLDETIGASLLTTSPTSPAGTSTEVTTFLTQVKYALSPEWTMTDRGGLTLTSYGAASRRDIAWTGGMTITYSVWRSIGITFDFQHTALSSNAPLSSFTDDVVTVGVSYKY